MASSHLPDMLAVGIGATHNEAGTQAELMPGQTNKGNESEEKEDLFAADDLAEAP